MRATAGSYLRENLIDQVLRVRKFRSARWSRGPAERRPTPATTSSTSWSFDGHSTASATDAASGKRRAEWSITDIRMSGGQSSTCVEKNSPTNPRSLAALCQNVGLGASTNGSAYYYEALRLARNEMASLTNKRCRSRDEHGLRNSYGRIVAPTPPHLHCVQ